MRKNLFSKTLTFLKSLLLLTHVYICMFRFNAILIIIYLTKSQIIKSTAEDILVNANTL
jgi:hypothetical protein